MAKTERRTIKIISVGSWRDAGKARVLEFAGEDRVNYETWSETLAEHIKVGATIEADVEFTERIHENKTYYHNKVVQIYVDGKPVKSRERGFYQDSPEKMASIENQKRADLICQLWIAGKIDESNFLVAKVQAWLSLLGTIPMSVIGTPVMLPTVGEKPIVAKKQEPSIFANAGEFLTACAKPPLKLNRTLVIVALRQANVDVRENTLDKLNFTDAYQTLIDAQREAQK